MRKTAVSFILIGRPKSKFALAILRYEIPEQYNINIDTPETKSKCYIEFVDGSRQI
jgi:hypothetical protein